MLRYMRKSSRDNARTPMQWNKGKNAGFSNQTPWIMVNPNYQTINAEAEMKDTNSIFHTYQKLIQLRKEYEIITLGKYELIIKMMKISLHTNDFIKMKNFMFIVILVIKKLVMIPLF